MKLLSKNCFGMLDNRIKEISRTPRDKSPSYASYCSRHNTVEGLNNKAKVVTRKSYGFKTAEILKISLYHKLGQLPVPPLAHKYF